MRHPSFLSLVSQWGIRPRRGRGPGRIENIAPARSCLRAVRGRRAYGKGSGSPASQIFRSAATVRRMSRRNLKMFHTNRAIAASGPLHSRSILLRASAAQPQQTTGIVVHSSSAARLNPQILPGNVSRSLAHVPPPDGVRVPSIFRNGSRRHGKNGEVIWKPIPATSSFPNSGGRV